MNEEEIEKIIEMTISKSNKEYRSLKEQFEELREDYIELARIEEQLQNNWNELKKFIEEEKNRLATQVGNIYEDSLDKIHFVNEDIFNELTKVSNKMQELGQGKDE